MTQITNIDVIIERGPAGPRGLYPQPAWEAGDAPYVRDTVLSHDGCIWLALRDTSVEPSPEAAEDWVPWLAFDEFATLGEDGKVPLAQLPAIAITDTYEVVSQAAMLALDAQRGDVAIRSDLNKSFVLGAEPAGTLENWKELKTPTGAVLSVNGQTGAVSLTKSDVGLANVPNVDTTDAGNLSSGALPDARLSSNVARRDQDNTFGDHAISRFCGVSSDQTDNYTLAAADNGTLIYVDKLTAVTVTLPNSLPAGFNCVVVQEGAGQITFATASGATRQSPNGGTKTAARYASAALFVKSNAGGSAADWRLNGELSA